MIIAIIFIIKSFNIIKNSYPLHISWLKEEISLIKLSDNNKTLSKDDIIAIIKRNNFFDSVSKTVIGKQMKEIYTEDGKRIGKREGKKEGKKEEKLTTAKKMKRQGFDTPVIKKITGLKDKDLMKI